MESKEKPRCRDCAKRIAYVDVLERGPECRNDPNYLGTWSTPPAFRGQVNPSPISSWNLSF
jgi:hypothetical protein